MLVLDFSMNKLLFLVEICKKRFKGLRDSYRAEIRKIQQGRIESSNWFYFQVLEFLRNIFDPDNIVPFRIDCTVPPNVDSDCLDNETNRLDDLIIDVDNDDSFDFEIMGDIFKRDSSETQGHDSSSDMLINKLGSEHSTSNLSMPVHRSDVETSPRLLSPMHLKTQPVKRSKRRKTSSSTDGPYHNGHTTIKRAAKLNAPDSDLKHDPDYNFLVSLLPHVKTLSSMNNMKFRSEVSRILMDLNQQDMLPNGQRESENTSVPSMPKLIPPPASNHQQKYSASEFLAQGCLIECDVKIENEALF